MQHPQWSKKYSTRSGGRDFLSYEYVGVLMLDRLLPGLSNITQRARYYSFYCWVLYRFFEKSELPKTTKNFRLYLKRKSRIFLYANGILHYNESRSGIDGIDSVRSDIEKNGILQGNEICWDEEDLNNYRGNYRVYSQKLKELRLTQDNDEHGPESLTQIGREVAETFEESLRHTRYYTDYCDTKEMASPIKIPISVLEEYGKACDVLGLYKSLNEQKALAKAFFRLEEIPKEEQLIAEGKHEALDAPRRRRESMALVLDMIDKGNTRLSYDDFQRLSYFAKAQSDGYKPHPQLKDRLEYWRMFHARQYFVYAIESIFRNITLQIENSPLSLEDVVQNILNGIDFQMLKSDFGIAFTADTLLSDIMEEIQKGKTGEDFDKACTLDSPLQEDALLRAIREHIHENDPTYQVGYSTLLLFLLFLRLHSYQTQKAPAWEFAEIGNGSNFSINDFFQEFNNQIQKGETYRDFLKSIIHDRIVLRHLHKAMEKLVGNKIDTFHFTYEEGLIKWQKSAYPKMNASRFQNTLNMLTDLSLIEAVSGEYAVTKTGKEILSRL
jgi:hypothetical protein